MKELLDGKKEENETVNHDESYTFNHFRRLEAKMLEK